MHPGAQLLELAPQGAVLRSDDRAPDVVVGQEHAEQLLQVELPAAETQVVGDDEQVLAVVARHQGAREQLRAGLDDACAVLVAHGAVDRPVLHLDGPEHHGAVRQDGRRGELHGPSERGVAFGWPGGNHGSSPFSRIDASQPATPASASGRTVSRSGRGCDWSRARTGRWSPICTSTRSTPSAVRTHPRATTMSPTTAPVDGISRAPNSPSAESVTVVPVKDSTIP